MSRGHEAVMLTSRSQPGLPRLENVAGVTVHRSWMPGKSPLGWTAHVASTVPRHRRLARDADVFHAHTFACVVPPMVTRARHRRPLVVTLHTSHFLMRANSMFWRPVFRRLIATADYLLATSEEIREVALSLYPHPRSEVMTNAVDTDRFRPGNGGAIEGRRRIIVPRRLFPKNGVEFFVRSLPLIARQIEVEAKVVGDGPERDRLTRLAVELGVQDRIEFLGARSNDEMPELLRGAELAVVPSLMEATSIAALEAMSSGVPVAASNVGGLPEIIDERVGSLFAPADPGAIADSVVSLLQRADLAELGREARRRVVMNWSLDRMVDRHIDIYNQLLDEAKTKRS